MARSTYVYLVTQYGTPFAAFTVKHELMTWAERTIPPHLFSEYRVHRMPDGSTFNALTTFNLQDFMQ